MKQGNWVPLSKALVKKLPMTREYSEVEAMFSISVDYDCDNKVSVAGYASLWGWSRKRVCNFLKKYGIEIVYKEKFNRHKKGQVALQVGNRIGTGKEQVEFINSKCLSNDLNRRGTGREQEGNRKGSTTKEPNPNPKPIKDNSRFTPPSLDEVSQYCQERNKGVDPERWMNHYSAKGWMIGKNKMKDWKAAVRTWEKNKKQQPVNQRDQYAQELLNEAYYQDRIEHN